MLKYILKVIMFALWSVYTMFVVYCFLDQAIRITYRLCRINIEFCNTIMPWRHGQPGLQQDGRRQERPILTSRHYVTTGTKITLSPLQRLPLRYEGEADGRHLPTRLDAPTRPDLPRRPEMTLHHAWHVELLGLVKQRLAAIGYQPEVDLLLMRYWSRPTAAQSRS
jgi:hypothetical protein